MTLHRAYPLYKPDWGTLKAEQDEVGIFMEMTDTRNGNVASRKYLFYMDSTAMMLLKLDALLHNMARELERKYEGGNADGEI